MTDLKVGDRVRVIKNPKWAEPGWVGRECVITQLYDNAHHGFDGDLNVVGDDDYGVMFNWGDIEPLFTPGQRVRGYVEGVVSRDNDDDIDWLMIGHDFIPLSALSDVTVIKTLPTAPSSVIEFENGELMGLNKSGEWVSFDDGAILPAHVLNNNWTVKYDAGA